MAENPACNPSCQACHYKKLDYPAQLQRKQKWAGQQLSRWQSVLRDIVAAPEREQLAYRSKSWMRTSLSNGVLSLGWFRRIYREGAWESEFISWNTCPLQTTAIQIMTERLRQALSNESLTGMWFGSPHLVIVAQNDCFDRLSQLPWDRILEPPFDRVWFHRNPQIEKKIFCKGPIRPLMPLEFPPATAHPIRAFRQVAQSLLVSARELALKSLLKTRPMMVLDLYCGTGELSLLLPAEVSWLGIERAKEATKFANTLAPPERAFHRAFAGTVEQRLRDPNVLSKIELPYALFVNPPRPGLTGEGRETVLALIAAKPPATVVYLSCSASSLARDLEAFEAVGYEVNLLQPYDFLPQTEHFETLAILETRF